MRKTFSSFCCAVATTGVRAPERADRYHVIPMRRRIPVYPATCVVLWHPKHGPASGHLLATR